MADKETVSVGCTIPNGISLHVMKRIPAKGADPAGLEDLGFINLGSFKAGTKQESFTSVDKDLWEIWLAENAESSLMSSGALFVQEPPPPLQQQQPPKAAQAAAQPPQKPASAVVKPTVTQAAPSSSKS